MDRARVDIQPFSVMCWQAGGKATPAPLCLAEAESDSCSQHRGASGARFQHLPEDQDKREVSESSSCCSSCLGSQMQGQDDAFSLVLKLRSVRR